MGDIAPTNALEALLASQMVATHHVAMHMFERALYRDRPSEAIDRMVTRAVRLQRLFAEQLNTLGKLRGHGGEQRLTVVHGHRHVHVHADAPRPAGVEPPPPGAGGEVPALAPGASGGEGDCCAPVTRHSLRSANAVRHVPN
jgi:hypothetical protein